MATQGSLRLAKMLVFGMLGLIVVLTAVVVGTVGARMFGSRTPAITAGAVPVPLPPGARIDAVDGASGRVLLLLSLPDGRQSLVAIEDGQATSLAETTAP